MVWEVVEHKHGDNPSITFKYHARDGEEGTLSLSLYVCLVKTDIFKVCRCLDLLFETDYLKSVFKYLDTQILLLFLFI